MGNYITKIYRTVKAVFNEYYIYKKNKEEVICVIFTGYDVRLGHFIISWKKQKTKLSGTFKM